MSNDEKELIKLFAAVSIALGIGVGVKQCNTFNNNRQLDKPGMKVDDTYISLTNDVTNYDDFFEIPLYTDNYDEKEEVYLRLGNETRKYIIKDIKIINHKPLSLVLDKSDINDFSLFMMQDGKYINIVPIEEKIIKVACKTHHKSHKFHVYKEQLNLKDSYNLTYKKRA